MHKSVVRYTQKSQVPLISPIWSRKFFKCFKKLRSHPKDPPLLSPSPSANQTVLWPTGLALEDLTAFIPRLTLLTEHNICCCDNPTRKSPTSLNARFFMFLFSWTNFFNYFCSWLPLSISILYFLPFSWNVKKRSHRFTFLFSTLTTRVCFQACISRVMLIEKHHTLIILSLFFTLYFFLLLNFDAYKCPGVA